MKPTFNLITTLKTPTDGRVRDAHGLPYAEGTGISTQPNKYNGKEFIEMHGYDEYDYGARNYYPAIGRWTSIDAKCELAYDISPYTYCHNNPVNTIDIDGNIDWKVVGTGVLATASGIGSVVGGVGLTTSTCGFGTPVGAALITEGVASIGLGVTTMLYGAMTDQSPKNTEFLTKMPTSPSQVIAKSADIMAGNEHGQIETAVGIGMIAVGKSVPLESEIFKTLSNIVSIAQAGIIISEQLHYDQQSFIECTTDDFSLELPQDNTRINEPKLIESIEYEK